MPKLLFLPAIILTLFIFASDTNAQTRAPVVDSYMNPEGDSITARKRARERALERHAPSRQESTTADGSGNRTVEEYNADILNKPVAAHPSVPTTIHEDKQ